MARRLLLGVVTCFPGLVWGCHEPLAISETAHSCPALPVASATPPAPADAGAGDAGVSGKTAGDTFVSCEGRYAVTFPEGGLILQEKNELPSPFGRLPSQLVARVVGGTTFGVAWYDLPHDYVTQEGAATILHESQDGHVKNRGTLESEREIRFDGEPARLFKYLITKSGKYAQSILILKGDRQYEVGVTAKPPDAAEGATVDAFLHSFTMTSCPEPLADHN